MRCRQTSHPDLWSKTLTKLHPTLKRHRHSLQSNLIRSKSHLAAVKSCLSILPDHRPPPSSYTPPSTFPLLHLPPPIRRRIYAALFAATLPTTLTIRDPATLLFYPEDTFPRILPGLCYASRQVYAESAALMLRGRTLVLSDGLAIKTLRDFLARSSNWPFAQGIRALAFGEGVNWQPFATHVVQRLLTRCVHLRHIVITVAPTACLEDDAVGKALVVRGTGSVVQQVDLSCLLACGGLRSVTLACVGGEPYAAALGMRVEAVFRAVVGWVRRNVCAGREVRMKVKYELWGVMVSNGFERV